MSGKALPGMGASEISRGDTVSLPSASAQVADIIRREIQRGDHPNRARLRQRDVADRLGVSTTPVREAFQALQAEGFLVVENHRGAIVVQPSVEDIEEGYAIRGSLESLAIRQATAHFDSESAKSLRDLLARMRSASTRDDWAAMDAQFHGRLNEMASMPRLASLIENLRSGVAFYIESAFEDESQRHAADDDHLELLEACVDGDADRAERILREHLQKTARVVIASMSDLHRATG